MSTRLTRVPLKQLRATGNPANVVFDGSSVVTEEEVDSTDYGIAEASFDQTSGTLSITLRNGETVDVSGLMTPNSVGVGLQGDPGLAGADGKDGLNGKDGARGDVGCRGPRGRDGARGPTGPTGAMGATGPTGTTGDKGDKGDPGTVQIFIQTEDPVNTSPDFIQIGALWIKP